MLTWHPRDFDTWIQMEQIETEERQEQEQDQRFAIMRKELAQRRGR